MLDEHPELFDFTDIATGTDSPDLRDPRGYHDGFVEIMRGQGCCAFFDGGEIKMKRGNEFSKQYDVKLRDEYLRRGNGMYPSACYPAAFRSPGPPRARRLRRAALWVDSAGARSTSRE